MNELRDIIAKNICDLRAERQMTQQKLAELMNYSDKAVSKWERGESIPDITVLKQLADYFEVSVDYLLEDEHRSPPPSPKKNFNHFIISALSCLCVWLVATLLFTEFAYLKPSGFAPWLVFIYAVFASATVALVFNSIWGRRRINYLIISLMCWSLILSLYLTLLISEGLNLWHLFIIGAPAEIIIIVWSALGKKSSAYDKNKIEKDEKASEKTSPIERK